MTTAILTTPSVQHALETLERTLQTDLEAAPGVLGRVVRAALGAGGKRMRPRLVYLAHAVCGGGSDSLEPARRYATAVEYLHTATLLHDDLVDGATLRRGEPAAHRRFGPKEAVLSGDLLLARCLSLVAGTGDPEAMATLAGGAERLALGEAMEVELGRRADLGRDLYFHYAGAKTGALFSAAAVMGARAAGATAGQREALARYGEDMGIAFQIADDVLDVSRAATGFGKVRGADLRVGAPSIVTIDALAVLDGEQRVLVARVVEGDAAHLDRALDLVETHGVAPAIAEGQRRAAAARSALEELPESPARDALCALADRSVERGS